MPTLFTSPATLSGLPPETPLLVAFSGGADSRLLLELTVDWARANGAPVTAAHLHHGIRGAEADRDEAFCRGVAAAHGIAYVCERADIPARAARSGRSLELEARLARYAFFSRVMQARGIPLLLTAHHADDQLETLLLRLLRGSGTHGLAGIPPVRPVPGGLLLRPLLTATRQDILDACRARGLTYVTDSTNLSALYSRNHIRHAVLPALTAVAPQAVDSMARTAKLLRADADYLDAEARRIYPTIVKGGALDTEKAQNIHRALLSRVLRMLYNESCGTVPGCTHIDALCDKILAGCRDFRLSLPGAAAAASHGHLRFSAAECGVQDFSLPLRPNVPVTLPWGETLLLTRGEMPEGFPGVPAAVFAAAAFDGGIVVRSRRDGDTIHYFGITHKAKRVIADAKLTPPEKVRLFFLAAGDTVLYIRALATADAAFYRGGDAMRLYIKSEESKGDAAGV